MSSLILRHHHPSFNGNEKLEDFLLSFNYSTIDTTALYSNKRKISLHNNTSRLDLIGHVERYTLIAEEQKYGTQLRNGEIFAFILRYSHTIENDFNSGNLISIEFGNLVDIYHTNFEILFDIK